MADTPIVPTPDPLQPLPPAAPEPNPLKTLLTAVRPNYPTVPALIATPLPLPRAHLFIQTLQLLQNAGIQPLVAARHPLDKEGKYLSFGWEPLHAWFTVTEGLAIPPPPGEHLAIHVVTFTADDEGAKAMRTYVRGLCRHGSTRWQAIVEKVLELALHLPAAADTQKRVAVRMAARTVAAGGSGDQAPRS